MSLKSENYACLCMPAWEIHFFLSIYLVFPFARIFFGWYLRGREGGREGETDKRRVDNDMTKTRKGVRTNEAYLSSSEPKRVLLNRWGRREGGKEGKGRVGVVYHLQQQRG